MIEAQNETTLHIQWVSGHCDIEGNEDADYTLANQGQYATQSEAAKRP